MPALPQHWTWSRLDRWTGGELMGEDSECELGLQGSGAEVVLGCGSSTGDWGRGCVCACVHGRVCQGAADTWLQLARPGVAGKHENPSMAAGRRGTGKLPAAGPLSWGRDQAAGVGGLSPAAARSPGSLSSFPLQSRVQREERQPTGLTSSSTSATSLRPRGSEDFGAMESRLFPSSLTHQQS